MWAKIIDNITNLFVLLGMGMFGGFTRVLLEPIRRSFLQIISYMIVSSFVCVGAGLYFIESEWGLFVSFLGMFCAGFFSHSLLNYLIKNEDVYIKTIEKIVKERFLKNGRKDTNSDE